MQPPPPPEQSLEFECPLCSGAFEISSQWLGHEVDCPHCGGAVQLQPPAPEAPNQPGEPPVDQPPVDQPLPGASDAAPFSLAETTADRPFEMVLPPTHPAQDEPGPTDQSATQPPPPPATPDPPPQKRPRESLTPKERDELKRRVNIVLAALGVVVLIATFLVLSWLAR